MISNLVADGAARGLIPPEASPHDLRHTFARRYLKEHAGDLVGLAQLLGHTDINTTAIYTRTTAEDLANWVEEAEPEHRCYAGGDEYLRVRLTSS